MFSTARYVLEPKNILNILKLLEQNQAYNFYLILSKDYRLPILNLCI